MKARIVALLAITIATAGCETFQPITCERLPEDNPEVRFTGGETECGVYQSSPGARDAGACTMGYGAWDGELLNFPGGMRYDLVHDLGRAPAWINLYLSFDRYGTSDGGRLAQAAGNQALITGADATSIHVMNDSCVPYWLLVTAGVGEQPSPSPPP